MQTKYIPPHLSEYLAQLSIAGPGVCFMRMTQQYWPENETHFSLTSDMVMATAALFNKEESEMIDQALPLYAHRRVRTR